MKMQAHFLTPFLLPLLALATACEPDAGQITEPVLQGQASLIARGKPDIIERFVFDPPAMFSDPFVCNGNPFLDVEVSGQFVNMFWTTDEPGTTIVKQSINTYTKYTNPVTGASTTIHDVIGFEGHRINFQLVEMRVSGGATATSPGEGIVILSKGVLKITTDFSEFPPETTIEFHGKGHPFDDFFSDRAEILC